MAPPAARKANGLTFSTEQPLGRAKGRHQQLWATSAEERTCPGSTYCVLGAYSHRLVWSPTRPWEEPPRLSPSLY